MGPTVHGVASERTECPADLWSRIFAGKKGENKRLIPVAEV